MIRVKSVTRIGSPPVRQNVEYEIGSDEPVSSAVVRAVSAVDGREPTSLPPLGNVVDTDALDGLFAARLDGSARSGGRISLVYTGYRITVDNGEYLTISPVDAGPP
jgi:hypothetical protein